MKDDEIRAIAYQITVDFVGRALAAALQGHPTSLKIQPISMLKGSIEFIKTGKIPEWLEEMEGMENLIT